MNTVQQFASSRVAGYPHHVHCTGTALTSFSLAFLSISTVPASPPNCQYLPLHAVLTDRQTALSFYQAAASIVRSFSARLPVLCRPFGPLCPQIRRLRHQFVTFSSVCRQMQHNPRPFDAKPCRSCGARQGLSSFFAVQGLLVAFSATLLVFFHHVVLNVLRNLSVFQEFHREFALTLRYAADIG